MAFNPYYGYTPQYGKTPYYIQQPMTTPQYQSQANEYMQNIQPATYQKLTKTTVTRRRTNSNGKRKVRRRKSK